jgi:hypothetical protein
MILYDLCLLPAQFRYLIMNIRYWESHVQLADQFASAVDINLRLRYRDQPVNAV